MSATVGVEPPVLSKEAETNGESNTTLVVQVMRHIFLGNLLGFAGISVPSGIHKESKLPIGFHMMSAPWDDHVYALVLVLVVHGFEPN